MFLAERLDESELWLLMLEICEAVAGRVCGHKRMPEFRDDAAAAAILAVVRHVHSHGWSDAAAILECADRAASRHAETQRRYWNRSKALVGPMEEGDWRGAIESDELVGELARMWKLALARLEVVHPLHAAHVRRRAAGGRLPDRHAMDSLRAAFVHVSEREARRRVEGAQVGLLLTMKVIAERGGRGSKLFSTFLRFGIDAKLC